MGKFKAPRITTAERTAITPEVSELIYDTDLEAMFSGDGSTIGGNQLQVSIGGVGKHIETIAVSAEQWVATHTLGTVDVVVQCYGSDGEKFDPESIVATNATTVTVELGSSLGDTGIIVIIG